MVQMNPAANFSICTKFRSIPSDFWRRVITDEQLSDCSDLEKLLAGCEIIVALDELDELLAA